MKVCIDAGHGMGNTLKDTYDPGACYTMHGVTYRESDIVLEYALMLDRELRKRHLQTYLTRHLPYTTAPVVQRAANAKKEGCDIFISLHCNAFETSQAHGTETLFGDLAYAGLADKMSIALTKASGLRMRDSKLRLDLAVLKFKGPALLLELGFITNKNDLNIMLLEERRTAMVNAMAGVIENATD